MLNVRSRQKQHALLDGRSRAIPTTSSAAFCVASGRLAPSNPPLRPVRRRRGRPPALRFVFGDGMAAGRPEASLIDAVICVILSTLRAK
jgi:hypothetical protein